MPRLNTTDGYKAVGDMVLLSWLAEGARGSSDPINFYATRDGNYNLLKMMGQDVSDDPSDTGIGLWQVYKNEVKDAGRKPRIDYLREFLGIKTGYRRPRFSFSEADLQWAQQTHKDHGKDLVLLFPQTLWKCREWPTCYWVELSWMLKARGVSVLVVLKDREQGLTNVPRVIWGFDISKVAALISLSSLVVVNDSGAAHLAGAMGIPTIALCGPTRPDCAFHHMPEIITLTPSGPPDCAGCHFQPPYRAACDIGCQVLYALQPHVVLGRIAAELALIANRPKIAPGDLQNR
ncbi:MAG TPA: glycosyltransferase family 9 protein [Pirellulales bacterium]|nr:glycosyltransferase family 9 protein [Pirellulales bacterium]